MVALDGVDSVLRRVQAMIADEAQRTKKTEEKRD